MDDVALLGIAEWARWPWLRAGFTTRRGGGSTAYGRGERNLGFTPEERPEVVEADRRQTVATLGGSQPSGVPWQLATVRQVHGDRVLHVTGGGMAGEGDGLVTGTPGVMLGILTADCVPVLVAETRQRLVGAFHAGWRGTVAGIAGAGVQAMVRQGARPEDLIAVIGPAIGPCCYQVGEEVLAAFGQRFGPATIHDGDSVDLAQANRMELLRAGVPDSGITLTGQCTGCAVDPGGRRRFFSHRADAGRTGRMMGLIGVSVA